MKKMNQKFLVIVKPGFFGSRFQIRDMFLSEGFEIVAQKATKFSKKIAKQFYSHLRDKPFFQEVIDYMTSDLVYTLVLRGDIEEARNFVGFTNPAECKPWQLRAKNFGPADKMRNVVHCSDSPESAEREIALIDNLPELECAWFVQNFREVLLPFFWSFIFSSDFFYNTNIFC